MLRSIFALAIGSIAAVPAGADDYAGPREFVRALSQSTGVFGADYRDMNRDGREEALVRLDDCVGADPEICTWMVGAGTVRGWGLVGGSQAAEARFRELPDGRVAVASDGVLWFWDGEILLPGLGLLYDAAPRQATSGEIDRLEDTAAYQPLSQETTRVFDLAPPDASITMRVVIIEDGVNRVGAWGTPYAVLDERGSLVADGVSSDLPRIFPRPEGGVSIIDMTPSGMTETIIR